MPSGPNVGRRSPRITSTTSIPSGEGAIGACGSAGAARNSRRNECDLHGEAAGEGGRQVRARAPGGVLGETILILARIPGASTARSGRLPFLASVQHSRTVKGIRRSSPGASMRRRGSRRAPGSPISCARPTSSRRSWTTWASSPPRSATARPCAASSRAAPRSRAARTRTRSTTTT